MSSNIKADINNPSHVLYKGLPENYGIEKLSYLIPAKMNLQPDSLDKSSNEYIIDCAPTDVSSRYTRDGPVMLKFMKCNKAEQSQDCPFEKNCRYLHDDEDGDHYM